ncbi:hypothetical protein CGLO_14264 [Colletotrichum gloeosporioides Cg-14]|nr:hypothetical protein CGLO_14264 [Colletotrichum gloeosporioides Cg-14]
MAHPAAN